MIVLSLISFAAAAQSREPMVADEKASAAYRWLNKEVLESRPLDDMEDLDHWSSFTTSGGAIVDARKAMKTVDSNGTVAAIGLTTEKVHHGNRSLSMRTPTRLPGLAPATGRGWGRAGIRRHFDGEDWTKYNRISLWIYPDLPGFYTTALDFQLYNDGREKLPALFGQEGSTSLILRNHEWNHIVWEIGNVARDKITAFEASYGLSGSAPGEADSIRFYFDDLTLERVDADKIEGWDVWKGRIAYSQAGYQTGAPKSAVASGLDANTFQLIDARTGNVAFSGAMETQTTPTGVFQVMDFSGCRVPGTYKLRAGTETTQPFPIDADVWEETVRKALNFFYVERCGMAVPGVHGVCHRDWTCVHGDKRININGGWHDAGDLSQQAEATDEITYALFSMAEKLQQHNDNPELYARVLEEAKWGLDWVLKTSFGDGFRDAGSINSRRTDGIMGNDDDITVTARNNPLTNFEAALVEAIAYRVLKESDPRLAGYALQMASADWGFAMAGLPTLTKPKGMFRGTFDSDDVEDELPSIAILAAVELYKATGERQYEDKAVAFAPAITGSQQRSWPDWTTPLAGFFYTSTARDRLLHYCHRGRDEAPTLALTALCHTFPDHPDWIKWYTSVTLYSEYLKKIAAYTGPYGVLPGGVYADTEYLHVPESRMESYREQVLTGVPLGKGHYLRLFPVWMDYRGHFGTILPQAQALAAAGALRNDPASSDLAERQLEWIIGRNPFAESTMYGEGQDFVPLYTPSSGDMVGGLPVGIQTRGSKDEPYWPVQSMWTYKEIWGHPVTNWIWLLSAIGGPAVVRGRADSAVCFTELPPGREPAVTAGRETVVTPDANGIFSAHLPEGRYRITSANVTVEQELLPGSDYTFGLRPDSAFSFTVRQSISGRGAILRLVLRGNGRHRIEVRGDGVDFGDTEKTAELRAGSETTVEFRGRLVPGEPWVAVVAADGDWVHGKEVVGE